MNKNYAKGRAKEYRIMKKYRDKGFTTLRSAGSHSFVDVICIDTENKFIKFIQVKPKSFSVKKTADLKSLNERFSGDGWRCAFDVE